MSIQQTEALVATVNELGYDSVEMFALEKAKEVLCAEMAIYQQEVTEFEHKYGMDFQSFLEKFDSISQVGLFEKEDDEMEWRACLKAIELVERKLKTLE
ncbi:hypothetical protein [Runella sp. SP2]|uniref:hypothetical protein n=1 Tax=Runella sp. SP2 TaxID=2268026 RepID=UPI000F077079|nr:hypothetical protein [Runella sp. SP2]AYQ34053.1 hypothetical protein DTQ70_18665 [Runella sp. SP2]